MQNRAGGRFIWFMDGHNKLRQHYLAVANANWRIAGVADMGADSKTNIIWLMGGFREMKRLETGNFATEDAAWSFVGAGSVYR